MLPTYRTRGHRHGTKDGVREHRMMPYRTLETKKPEQPVHEVEKDGAEAFLLLLFLITPSSRE
jgi:hypothetical protein